MIVVGHNVLNNCINVYDPYLFLKFQEYFKSINDFWLRSRTRRNLATERNVLRLLLVVSS